LSETKKSAPRRGQKRGRGEHASVPASAVAHRRGEEHTPGDAQTFDGFQHFLHQAGRYPLLTAAEEVELAQGIERGDLAAKDRLVNSNLRLVVSIARKYQGLGLPLQDLVQEAMVGLIRATEKFDWRKGFKFSTYATLWIRQSIQRGLDNSGRPIRVPANVAQDLRTLNRAENELTAELDRTPSVEELAAHSKFNADEVAALRDLTRVTTSLGATVTGDSETTLGELRADEAPMIEDDVADRHREEAISDALGQLPDLERQVLELRFGTGGEAESTLRAIARRLKIGEERARQLEASGLERLAAEGSLDAWREAA